MAYIHRIRQGLPLVHPKPDENIATNFLYMMFGKDPAEPYRRAMNIALILHADHEQNCSAAAMRGIGSSHVDPFSAMAGAAGGPYGPPPGGVRTAWGWYAPPPRCRGTPPRPHPNPPHHPPPPTGRPPPAPPHTPAGTRVVSGGAGRPQCVLGEHITPLRIFSIPEPAVRLTPLTAADPGELARWVAPVVQYHLTGRPIC